MNLYPDLTQKISEIKRTLVKKIYIEAYKRILSERVIVEIVIVQGEKRYALGIKGVPNFYGATAEDNAIKTFNLINKYAKYCGYRFDFIINQFENKQVPARKALIACEIDENFYKMIIQGKMINELNNGIGKLQFQLV
ncbi:hypothetical protein [Lysinibacillus sp. K60]|uniref:hypothetical protein n=1 Tax=Lysinibacillus sp. K60 TaxID=2720027 RepID=UPI001C8C6D45|nr:hypothetical protein [Lysinibacillus sp. K60]MBX8945871.1 hypothetical protein [Lysinibacillus sp. K60]